MKKFILVLTLFVSLSAFAQDPPPPPGDASSGGGPIGGSAPVGGGLAVMAVLSLSFAAWKKYSVSRSDLEHNPDRH